MQVSMMREALSAALKDPKQAFVALREPAQSVSALRRKANQRHFDEVVPDGDTLNPAFAEPKLGLEEATLQTIVSRSRKVLDAYLDDNRKPLEKLLADRTYLLVVGSPRTGGSYVTSKLRDSLCDYAEDDVVVKNESIPSFHHLANHDDAHHRRQALFQLVQWLVWIDMRYQDHDVIVKKSSGFPHAMGLVDEFFGDADVEFVVTTRHPGAVYRSNSEHHLTVISVEDDSYLFTDEIPDWWTEASSRLRALIYWHKLYTDLVTTSPSHIIEDMRVVAYGKQESAVTDTVEDISEEALDELVPMLNDDPFRLTDREYSSFWHSPVARTMVDDVRESWAREDLTFPVEHDRIA